MTPLSAHAPEYYAKHLHIQQCGRTPNRTPNRTPLALESLDCTATLARPCSIAGEGKRRPETPPRLASSPAPTRFFERTQSDTDVGCHASALRGLRILTVAVESGRPHPASQITSKNQCYSIILVNHIFPL